MTDVFTLTLAQLNPTVGDIRGNLAKLRSAREEAARQGADLLVPGELLVSGYPPEDLVRKPMFISAVEAAVRSFAEETADGGPAVAVTTPWPVEEGVGNAVVVCDGGEIVAVRLKHILPNYGVFDEKRVFVAGALPGPVNLRGVRVGLPICEDMWVPDVAECLQESGAEMLVVPNGSPYEVDKLDLRIHLMVERVIESGLPLVYVNQVGGQDELVFDGASFALDSERNLVLQGPAFEEHLTSLTFRRDASGRLVPQKGEMIAPPSQLEALYRAMVVGLRDYVGKNRFPGVVLGLSGGIDSALSAAVAVDALGPEHIHCVMMPSPYTSRESLEDAEETARLLGVHLDSIPIEPAMNAFETMLRPLFDGRPADITEENVQSRTRGLTLMALSNKFGHMVLSTGNKSEMSTGYATLYGDMCGGYSVLKDVYKTTVFRLSAWRNQSRPADAFGPPGRVIPERVITKPPSAELKPDQRDEDSLPPYETLDDVLRCLIEREMPVEEIVARGHLRDVVLHIWRLLDRAEYKRRQAPPGVKLTERAFGKDRRYPITNAYRAG